MPPSPAAGVVLYASNAARLTAFYSGLLGFPVVDSDGEYALLRSQSFELVVLTTPEARAARGIDTQPPTRRADVAIKPVFVVSDLATARERAAELGGSLGPSVDEWRFREFTVCDGVDPEGNVFQLRQLTA